MCVKTSSQQVCELSLIHLHACESCMVELVQAIVEVASHKSVSGSHLSNLDLLSPIAMVGSNNDGRIP